ncbi:hypothetical protein NMY22_g17695 [Coprinellus aureogranulatus]|nr:hypothetical protein NMY22_g17695 [Coprinellus aureogranulatus]
MKVGMDMTMRSPGSIGLTLELEVERLRASDTLYKYGKWHRSDSPYLSPQSIPAVHLSNFQSRHVCPSRTETPTLYHLQAAQDGTSSKWMPECACYTHLAAFRTHGSSHYSTSCNDGAICYPRPTPQPSLGNPQVLSFPVYDPRPITDVSLNPGDYFALQPNSSFNDGWCASNSARPELILAPHVAPLDLKFGVKKDDDNLYLGMHGSYNTDEPIGYKVVIVSGKYESGRWVPSSGIQTPTTDLLANQDESNCDDGCFRPVGLAFDKDGNNLFVTSDTSGEVFLVKRGNGAFSSFKHHPPAVAAALVIPTFLYVLSALL